ncbi:GNAT family N-acetyltransferase [Chitinimonas koreensis]|uniref:GNAT family N-acetyltransferase n=1 Tax=Chitinimonas koreensis TaxID=356302 RepID=UPI00048B2A31|nr:GNAT family N-acetyltransferase [Chitinimonas koreensis]QNM95548.1 GNAT family N-acetyltransferase [Chitinimonas koreensis]
MSQPFQVRLIERDDFTKWRPLWEGYNAFYGRAGATALPESITLATWERFFNPIEPVFALVAAREESLIGIAHFLFHRSTTRVEPVCYLQDLFTEPLQRGQGIGKALIQSVYAQARSAGASRVYWQTQASNEAGRALYDQVAKHLGFIVYSHETSSAA